MTVPLATWPDLPVPEPLVGDGPTTVYVTVGPEAWRHVRDKHVGSSGEPWAEWLTHAVVKEAARADDGPLVADVLESLRQAMERGLRRPLVMAYRAYKTGRAVGRDFATWVVLLPAGAVAVLRPGDPGRGRLVTCFYPRSACRGTAADRRWAATARRLVGRYAVMTPGVGFTVPPPTHLHAVPAGSAEPEEIRTDFRFVTPASWGFRADLRGQPWRGPLPPWDGPLAARDRRVFRLRRRKEVGRE